MDYNQWFNQLKQRKSDAVQVRMMSTGNDLVCWTMPLKYGVCLVNDGEGDRLDMSGSNLGGSPTAELELRVKPTKFGYVVRADPSFWDRLNRKVDGNGKFVGFSFTRKGSDRIAYQKALDFATEIATATGAELRDLTSEDISKLAKYKSLHLEDRVYHLEERLRA